jgi:hypothetical protein
VKVTNTKTSRSVWCEVIKAGNNFITRYNENKKTQKVDEQTPFMISNEWYRDKLELKKNETNQIEVRCYRWLPLLVKQLFASYTHPDNNVRLAVDLSFVSVLLGLVGLVLGVISLCK